MANAAAKTQVTESPIAFLPSFAGLVPLALENRHFSFGFSMVK
ncbi:hypothetical protein SD77_2524 [Bacillus badius]|uniref:Uncharacterized protein n=1 Tax=Bacillus badius TaxID=1455 RepID=A0ABR5AZL8_BACBA|nr:hypothetical protein SD78_2016 [Bacillus badius]KIL80070.1 hypothetical protein SD77_2524 [Bacillus badius]